MEFRTNEGLAFSFLLSSLAFSHIFAVSWAILAVSYETLYDIFNYLPEMVLNLLLCVLVLLGMVKPLIFAVMLSAFRWIVFANLQAKVSTGMYILINVQGWCWSFREGCTMIITKALRKLVFFSDSSTLGLDTKKQKHSLCTMDKVLHVKERVP